jgi:TM2 domain-containing membrane protein YozV
MNKRRNPILFTLIVLSFITLNLHAGEMMSKEPQAGVVQSEDSLLAPTPSTDDTLTQQEFRKEKLIAAILAFPVPFGFTGMHRIYLGSGPWVPVVYLCTGGGGFGLLPLIDFIFILKSDREEFEKYLANPKLFMWVE